MLQNKKDTMLRTQTTSFSALIMVGLKYYSKLEFILSPEKVRVKKDIFVLNVYFYWSIVYFYLRYFALVFFLFCFFVFFRCNFCPDLLFLNLCLFIQTSCSSWIFFTINPGPAFIFKFEESVVLYEKSIVDRINNLRTQWMFAGRKFY